MSANPTLDKDFTDSLVQLRREFHRHPELSGEEEQTAERIIRELEALGLSYRSGIAGHGIIAEIPGEDSGSSIGLRADMDALPIHEETGLEFASHNKGKMHACAHDGHMTMLIGAAKLLVDGPPPPMSVKLVFQPSEEIGEGARDMMKTGLLDDLAAIYGGHLDRHYSTGAIIVNDGPMNAASDSFSIRIRGQGAHGARPHEAVDAVVVGSLIVMTLQTIVSREVDPAHPSVVSVGQFSAGTAPNVIAGEAELHGTIRCQDETVRKQLSSSIERIATSVAELHGATVSVKIIFGTPPLINTPEQAELARIAAGKVVAAEMIKKLHTANMGAEDFAYFLEKFPGAYVRFGAQVVGREGFPAHSSRFDFDEGALPIGAAYLAQIAKVAGAHFKVEK